MRIHVGSTNPNKVGAVMEVFTMIDRFAGVEVVGVDVSSSVSEQPQDLAETVRGATNRAKAAKGDADFGIGLEAGMMEVPGAGKMNIQVCAIFDGTMVHHGLSSAYGLPASVSALMTEQSKTMGEAVHETFPSHAGINSKEAGLIAVLSDGRVTRKDLCMQAVQMAMVHLG